MSWTDSFPVMSEEMVVDFESLATPFEKEELAEWFGVQEIFNPQDKRHLACLSLFWKPASASESGFPAPTREILLPTGEREAEDGIEPWSQYFLPILETVPPLVSQVDDVTVRIYLAADLAFLVPDLVGAGCEVYLMRHPSLAHAPAVAWRVLAFSEKDRLVTLTDSTRLRDIALDIKRTRAMDQGGLACWREPVTFDFDPAGRVAYRPFKGCHLGLVGGWPMERLLHAFTWHFIRGNFPSFVELPGCSPKAISAEPWPDRGFEKWFLTVAMYPRWAAAGMLTFVPTGFHSSMLLMDIEYATWANPKSELVIFPSGASCCGPGPVMMENASPENAEEEVPVVPTQNFEGAT